MHNTNVTLSENEWAMVNSKEVILTKNRIIEKVYQMFGSLSNDYTKITTESLNNLPAEILKPSPKIYKGEQYKGLPYVMLDYPRFFLKNDAMAIRSFFWWGNFFSITLHLSGKYVPLYAPKVLDNLKKNGKTDEWFLCINDTEWEHHFDEENYQTASSLLSEVNKEIFLEEKPFFKLSKKNSLEAWNGATDFFKVNYVQILHMLHD